MADDPVSEEPFHNVQPEHSLKCYKLVNVLEIVTGNILFFETNLSSFS